MKLCRECWDYLKENASSIYLAKQHTAETSGIEMENVPSELIDAILAARTDIG